MGFSESVKVMLYARSGNRCAFPGCPISLVFTLQDSKSTVNHGKAAHIVAESKSGPRGKSKMSVAERNSYSNGIILCSNHHSDVVDKFPEKYRVTQLRKWKADHEIKYAQISSSVSKQFHTKSIYAEYIDRWSELALLDGWYSWTAPILRAGSNCISQHVYFNYLELCSWLATRVWLGKFKHLEYAFWNFGRVASDLIFVFDKHSEAHGNMLCTDKFYRNCSPTDWTRRQALLKRFEFHVALVEDLVVELTRAGNLVCQRVRETVDGQFRVEQGLLLLESGMYEDMSYRRHVVQYAKRELTKAPYPGLEKFMKIREKRDLHFGTGVVKAYLKEND